MANLNGRELEELLSNDEYQLSAGQFFLSYFINERNTQTLINFATDTLGNVLTNYLTTDTKRVLLYLHKSNDTFSSDFCDALVDSSVQDILGDSAIFTVIAWDISTDRDSTRGALEIALRSTLGNSFSDYVSSNKSVALLIAKSTNVTNLCKHSKDLDNFINVLKNCQKIAHRINGDNPLDVNEEINSTNFQQRMFDLLGDRDYDSFESDQHDMLRCKIGYHLYGPPDVPIYGPFLENDGVSILNGIYSYERAEENIDKLLKKIIGENNKYCKWNGRVVISFIYICAEPLAKEKQKRKEEAKLAKEKQKRKEKAKLAKEEQQKKDEAALGLWAALALWAAQLAKGSEKSQNQDYNPHSDFHRMPLFVIRKCKGQKGKTDKGPFCRLFIDDSCRVYKSWDDYLNNNKLPPCLMFCPYLGKYQSLNDDGDVSLEEHFSPSASTSKKVLNAADTGLGIAGLVAGGVFMFPAAPAVLVGATVLGVGSGIFAAGRGVHTVIDRLQYGQEITLRNAECRGAIITIAGSALTLGMMGSVKVVSYLAANGVAVGQGTRLLLYGLGATALGINGVGIGNTIYEMYCAGESPTALQVLQLGASIFFFGNSLYNFRAIGTVIDESQARALSEIEGTLSSNRMRRMFNKMLKETMRLEGNTAGKAEVISAMRNMDNPKEVLRILNRNNKNLNSAGVRFSVQDGNVLLNGQHVDIMDISRMSAYDRSSFLRNLPAIPENLTPNVSYSINTELNSFIQQNRGLLQATVNLATTKDTAKFVEEVLSAFEPPIRKLIFTLSQRFFGNLSIESIDTAVVKLFPCDDPFLLILRWICNTLVSIPAFAKISNQKLWNNADLNPVLEDLMRRFRTWITDLIFDRQNREDRKERRRENNEKKEQKICKVCEGHFYS